MSNKMTDEQLDKLLDVQADMLADLPSFKPFPAGTYHVIGKSVMGKQIGDHPSIEIKWTFKEVIELAEPTDEPPKAKDETSVSFQLDNEFGQGGLKKLLLVEEVPGVRQFKEKFIGTEYIVVLKQNIIKKDKEDKKLDIADWKYYQQIISMVRA